MNSVNKQGSYCIEGTPKLHHILFGMKRKILLNSAELIRRPNQNLRRYEKDRDQDRIPIHPRVFGELRSPLALFPTDVWNLIFCYLSVRDLPSLCLVCKEMRIL